MSKQIKIYDILLSSPNDVENERKLVTKSIEEINSIISYFGVEVRLIKWETNTHSSIGNSAQEVITKQFGSDFDIYLGIMGHRFGTPTEKADSGTEDEFNVAYEIYKKGTKPIDIKFYFSSKAVSTNKINPKQLAKVQKFKDKIQKQGVYTFDYGSDEEFISRIRTDIINRIFGLIDFSKFEPKSKEKPKT